MFVLNVTGGGPVGRSSALLVRLPCAAQQGPQGRTGCAARGRRIWPALGQGASEFLTTNIVLLFLCLGSARLQVNVAHVHPLQGYEGVSGT